MRPSGAMTTCASAEASSAWLRMSTRPASAVCIALAAKAAKPLITASAITVLVTAWALAPEMMSLAKSAPTKAPAAARRSAILPSRPIQPGCWRSNPQFAQRRAPSTSATMLRFRPLRVRLQYHGPAAHSDRLLGLLAIAVSAGIDARQRGIDFRNQLSLTVAGPQFDRPFGLQRGTVGQVGLQQAFFLQVLQCPGRIGEELGAPAQQLLPKVFELPRVHELFGF